ncbi:MAG TPA: aminotransferase class I/II-fold pyridoxal phosphate-dependent enzyme [Thermoanaerobaculia bacterium]|jgi:histidinol-phosphate aminotransferase|nr:aminotransferase class I/II-fold pyridoxal phosphate-dependent enzyme [Thermoanaerobaculia bacterium]
MSGGRPIDVSTLVREDLRTLPDYPAAEPGPCRWKLDQNESPWEPSRRVKESALRSLLAQPWSRYPDRDGAALRRRLGELHGWPAEGVLVGNGSNELLALAITACAGPGSEVVGAEPTFALYRSLLAAAGARGRFLPPRADLALPLAELRAEVARDPRRPLLLCSPNNPTGAAATVAEVDELLQALEAPLLLDNAYGELCSQDYHPLLARHRHLLLFGTLSKAWALGGVRVGYLLADPELVRLLAKVKLPYNLGRAALALAEATLGDPGAVARRVGVLRARRDGWTALLRRHGLEVLPSEASFVLVRWGAGEAGVRQAAALRAALLLAGIRVRDVGRGAGLAGCLRITVGPGGALRAAARALAALEAEAVRATAGELAP